MQLKFDHVARVGRPRSDERHSGLSALFLMAFPQPHPRSTTVLLDELDAGRKVSDEFTVPLCRGHHREVHRYRDEVAWWQKAGVDPIVAARALWLETHPMATGPD